jgi:hypothetical protein
MGTFTVTRTKVLPVTMAAYTGPGDIVSGAMFWYGLRGYTAAYSTGSNPAVDLVDQSGANQITINILSDGTLDVASISAWQTAHSVTTTKLKTLYDQSGFTGQNLTQSTVANMPELRLSQIGSLPSIWSPGFPTALYLNATLNQSSPISPFSIAGVGSNAADGNDVYTLWEDVTDFFLLEEDGSIKYNMFGGATLVTSSTVDSNVHAVQAVFNGTSSVIRVDATETTGDAGTNTMSANASIRILASAFPDHLWNGKVGEVGGWPVALSSGQRASLQSNAKSYWGTP